MQNANPQQNFSTNESFLFQVLLVEDRKASTSACALEIEVGNFLDPPHLLGMKHFRYVISESKDITSIQVWLTYSSTQYSTHLSCFHRRASDIS